MWPFSKSKRVEEPVRTDAPVPFTAEQMEEALLVYKGEGAHFSLLYANMAGYPHEVIKPETIREFNELIEAGPNFTEAGRQYALERLTHDVDFICSSDVFDILMFGHDNDENVEHRDCLNALRAAVNQSGFSALCERIGFDAMQFIEQTAVSRREADLRKMIARLEDRKDYLKPLLLRALAQGKNKYGEQDYGKYIEEVSEFMDHYFPNGSLSFYFNKYPLVYVVNYLEQWIQDTPDPGLIPVDGIDFEHWCAARIEEQGWAVRVSKASGDQGVDIEAMKEGMTVAIQCKRYAQPIGNKAVQEAYAGMIHYRADASCVIGTGGYTASALELGQSTGVILIDAASISEFSYLVEAHIRRK